MENMRKKVIDLTISIALEESVKTGIDYTECISKALDEACLKLEVNRKEFIRMFL